MAANLVHSLWWMQADFQRFMPHTSDLIFLRIQRKLIPDCVSIPVAKLPKPTVAQCLADYQAAYAIAVADSSDDEADFEGFIASQSGNSVNVLTRSGKFYDSTCSSCGRVHPFNYVCGPMVQLSAQTPEPSSYCSDGRSQCERICWCDSRNYFTERDRRRSPFLAWRASVLKRDLGLPSIGFPGVVILPPRHTTAADDAFFALNSLAPLPVNRCISQHPF